MQRTNYIVVVRGWVAIQQSQETKTRMQTSRSRARLVVYGEQKQYTYYRIKFNNKQQDTGAWILF